jgi:hypothetical protein
VIARLRDHKLLVAVAAFGTLSLLVFTWGVWADYAAREIEHHGHPAFWSMDFLATWSYNAASNWQSEALVGVLVVWLLKSKGDEDL